MNMCSVNKYMALAQQETETRHRSLKLENHIFNYICSQCEIAWDNFSVDKSFSLVLNTSFLPLSITLWSIRVLEDEVSSSCSTEKKMMLVRSFHAASFFNSFGHHLHLRNLPHVSECRFTTRSFSPLCYHFVRKYSTKLLSARIGSLSKHLFLSKSCGLIFIFYLFS